MLAYSLKRLLLAVPTIFVISVLSFVLIQLPPGDFLSSYAATLASMGEQMSGDTLQLLREAYGLDQPMYVQYYKWVWGIISQIGRAHV